MGAHMTSATPRIDVERGGIVPDAMVVGLYQKMLTVFYVEERLKVFDRLVKVQEHSCPNSFRQTAPYALLHRLPARQDVGFSFQLSPRRTGP